MDPIDKELHQIALENKGVLDPKEVVAAAKKRTSALHNQFEWNSGKAAEEYRLHQARQLIQCRVTVLEHTADPVRTWVSLSGDRKTGGGYRMTLDVLRHEESTSEMLDDALKELNRFRRKYRTLKELRNVFREIEKVEGAMV